MSLTGVAHSKLRWPKPEKRQKKTRKPLQRSKPIRRKGKTKHARRKRDFGYMAWVATRSCLARLLSVQGNDCKGRVHAHHMRGRYIPNADRACIPLCEKHHSDWHGRVGGNGIFEGWGKIRRWNWAMAMVATTQLEHAETHR